MDIKLKGKELNLKLIYKNKKITFDELFNTKKRQFNFELNLNDNFYKGKGIRGDDSIFIPFSKEMGVKITKEKPQRDDSIKEALEMTTLIMKNNIEIFPKIFSTELVENESKETFLITFMENIINKNIFKIFLKRYNSIKNFVPLRDLPYLIKNLNIYPYFLDKFYYFMEEYNLFPEDEWYKKTNLINNKIVDFSRFKILKERYHFPSNKKTKAELLEEYYKLKNIFAKNFNSEYIPQWKGSLYEGFKFDNGFIMEGYKSDHYRFDCYKKLPFIPFNKIKNKSVLDIGSNHGFFSFQSIIHGAKNVVAIELDSKNIKVAEKLKELMNIRNIEFINQDVTNYLFETNNNFELIIMNSVLHQIYKNYKGADNFLKQISNKCNYFVFETPVNHPTVNIKLSSIHKKLRKYFSTVRVQNIYKAYSAGYRAIYICYK
ncbi:hypothetical protein PMT9312_1325 [Prochlorococcus marinus str. MIT 9312]|uniref:Methyltransferase domain-containing protein n=1 Tax=Prochlorococcus marinus (strain MIT 9312) TaxID=74546 RepID=Q319R1_PROM9|nr:class I SAM-dependent methyltransferase [Prochlorococcus marinus]ABB50384.1 hypothetical protein PMT9312_1325 [Prochlorococcus marinus str. MIT 9312]